MGTFLIECINTFNQECPHFDAFTENPHVGGSIDSALSCLSRLRSASIDNVCDGTHTSEPDFRP
jgi:hypothetical protein